MPQFTKRAIVDSFFKLAESRPLEKITVKDIVEDCGVTRNTFYYYFRDVYDVIDDVFLTEAAGVLEKNETYDSLADALLNVNDFVFKHRGALRNIYNSIGRDKIEDYISKVTNHALDKYIRAQAAGLNADPRDLKMIAAFYREAMLGLMFQWLRNDIQDDPIALIRRLEFIFSGHLQAAIERSAQHPPKPDGQ